MSSKKDIDEISFPKVAHHETVKSKLRELVEEGEITEEEADKVYSRWKDKLEE